MADNYLEMKEEALRSGKPVYRRDNPSLDRLIEFTAGGGEARSGYVVSRIQLEAVLRSAGKLGLEFSSEIDEKAASIRISARNEVELGELLLAMRLKAAELRLQAKESPAGKGEAEIYFWR